MQWPITDLILAVGVGVLIFLVARSRPVVPQNGMAMHALVQQISEISRERDELRADRVRFEQAVRELQAEVLMHKRTIQDMQRVAGGPVVGR